MKGRNKGRTENRTNRPGKTCHALSAARTKGSNSTPHVLPRVSSSINDNQCFFAIETTAADREPTRDYEHFKCKVTCCKFCSYCARAFAKERNKSRGSSLFSRSKFIKICERCFLCHSIVSCKYCNKCSQCCHKSSCRGQTPKFWEKWSELGSGPKVVQILREGYTLPFRTRPNLSRTPTVVSCYGNPHRNLKLLEALHQLTAKNAIERVHKQTSLGFFNRLFLVPKPNNKWRPILDLSNLNPFLKTEKFKMETPETIRTSLQKGEWVTSIDFKDAYFHIPIQEQSRKYLRFHAQGQTFQFKALPFGLSTAPMEFTVIAKEVKLMATQKGYKAPPIPRRLVGEGHIPPGPVYNIHRS